MNKIISKRVKILIAIVLAGEAIFFLPFTVVRIFRPGILQAFQIDNTQLGQAFGIYGICAMISYLLGGPLADRVPVRNLMAFSLWVTAIGTLFLLLFNTYQSLLWVYGFWGVSTILLFWSAMIRATREWGGDFLQGKAFGYLEGGRGISAALVATLMWFVYSNSSDAGSAHQNTAFDRVLWLYVTITIIIAAIGWLVWKVVPKKVIKNSHSQRIRFSQLLAVTKNKNIWLQSVIVICAYVGYKTTDDISLYGVEVLGLSDIDATGMGTFTFWLRPLFAVIAGFLADKKNGLYVITLCFVGMIAGSFFIFLGLASKMLSFLLILTCLLAGVYGIRGVYFAILEELKVPLPATGTAVGIISFLGYTPDIFMGPLMGLFLDSGQKNAHQLLFGTFLIFAVVGLGCTLILRRIIK